MSLIPFNKKENSLATRDPFMNMLDSFFNDTWLPSRSLLGDTFKIDVGETDSEYTIEAELPGVDKKEINIGMNEGVLTISTARSEENDKNDENYIHRERRYTSMQRTIRLADASDHDVKASLNDGILTIKVPKEHKQKDVKRIEIQ